MSGPVKVKIFKEPPYYHCGTPPLTITETMNEFLRGVDFIHATQAAGSGDRYANQIIKWTVYYREIEETKLFDVNSK